MGFSRGIGCANRIDNAARGNTERGMLQRKIQPENGPFAHRGFDLHASAVFIHDLLDDRESKSGPVLLAVSEEGLEEPAPDILRYAMARIRDPDHQESVFCGGAER